MQPYRVRHGVFIHHRLNLHPLQAIESLISSQIILLVNTTVRKIYIYIFFFYSLHCKNSDILTFMGYGSLIFKLNHHTITPSLF